jgi:hypothetical protein
MFGSSRSALIRVMLVGLVMTLAMTMTIGIECGQDTSRKVWSSHIVG